MTNRPHIPLGQLRQMYSLAKSNIAYNEPSISDTFRSYVHDEVSQRTIAEQAATIARLEAELAAAREGARVLMTPKRIDALSDILDMATGDAGWGSQADTVQEMLWIATGAMEDEEDGRVENEQEIHDGD